MSWDLDQIDLGILACLALVPEYPKLGPPHRWEESPHLMHLGETQPVLSALAPLLGTVSRRVLTVAAAPGTGEAPDVVLLVLDVPDGGGGLVDGDLVLASVQGAPHPRRLDSWFEVCHLLGNPFFYVLNCKTDIGQS